MIISIAVNASLLEADRTSVELSSPWQGNSIKEFLTLALAGGSFCLKLIDPCSSNGSFSQEHVDLSYFTLRLTDADLERCGLNGNLACFASCWERVAHVTKMFFCMRNIYFFPLRQYWLAMLMAIGGVVLECAGLFLY